MIGTRFVPRRWVQESPAVRFALRLLHAPHRRFPWIAPLSMELRRGRPITARRYAPGNPQSALGWRLHVTVKHERHAAAIEQRLQRPTAGLPVRPTPSALVRIMQRALSGIERQTASGPAMTPVGAPTVVSAISPSLPLSGPRIVQQHSRMPAVEMVVHRRPPAKQAPDASPERQTLREPASYRSAQQRSFSPQAFGQQDFAPTDASPRVDIGQITERVVDALERRARAAHERMERR